ncbi:MAG: IS110 family transposase [Anaerolineae bacterium]|nr:IS110 family transposase [Anaerolineae bacterium]
MSAQVYVGADIAAEQITIDWLDTQTQTGEQLSLEQSERDYARLLKRLTRQAQPAAIHVVMEATGNYWMAFASFLHAAGLIVSVLNPSQARHFAQARLQRAKTDPVDAALLRDYGRLLQPDPWVPPPPICQQLQQLLNRREDLLQIRTAERNRLHALHHHPLADPVLRRQLQHHIAYLSRQIDALKRAIQQLLFSDHDWAEAVKHLRTLKGLGDLTIARILTATHAFARCASPDEAASFAGLAPHPRDSGQHKGKRSVGGGGHAPLRQSLYMAALSASRFNPVLKVFYSRLLQRGKLKPVALCAVARKLLHIAWALVVKHCDFDPDFYFKSLEAQLPT